MPHWREEYLANITKAEKLLLADHELIETCSQLSDRISVLEAEKAQLRPSKRSTTPSSTTTEEAPDAVTVARLRASLAEALRGRTQSDTRLRAAEADVCELRTRADAEGARARRLSAERRALAVKLRDRDDELRAKTKMVVDVQDELAVLHLQLDVVERKRAEKERENSQLVERFMRRVGEEAEAMNLANEPSLARNKR